MTLASSSYLNQPLRSPEEVERQRQPRTMAEKCSAVVPGGEGCRVVLVCTADNLCVQERRP